MGIGNNEQVQGSAELFSQGSCFDHCCRLKCLVIFMKFATLDLLFAYLNKRRRENGQDRCDRAIAL